MATCVLIVLECVEIVFLLNIIELTFQLFDVISMLSYKLGKTHFCMLKKPGVLENQCKRIVYMFQLFHVTT